MNPIIRAGMYHQAQMMKKNDAPRLAAQTLPEGVDAKLGLPYTARGGRHLLDVYRPQNAAGPLPIVVDIHGGGLLYGDLALNRNYCHHLALQNRLVIGLEYTLAPHARFRTQLRELCAGLRYACAHAEEWGGDLRRGICLTGDSAGGYLALYVAALNANPALRQAFRLVDARFPARVRALGLVCPMSRTDVSPFALMESELYGPLFRQREFYPYLKPQVLAQSCILPPCWIQTSEEDFIRAHSRGLAAALHAAGKPYRLVDLPRGTPAHPLAHVFSICWPDWPESQEMMGQMLDFFDSVSG